MASLYSMRSKAPLTAYERLKVWRAKQYAFNDIRTRQANMAANGIFSAKINMMQRISELTVNQAVTRIKSGVDKLV